MTALPAVASDGGATLLSLPRKGQLHRHGLPAITGAMVPVLLALREIAQDDKPFMPFPDVDARTIRALENRDWIVEIPARGEDVAQYKITKRGLHALAVYEPVVKRADNLCPRCCERQRFMFKTGTQAPYCKQCQSEIGKRQYRLKLYRLQPGGLCARCHKRPRFVASSGKVYCYCQHCKNLLHRQEHKRKREELFIRVIVGDHVPCTRPGCDCPRYLSGQTVQDYCYKHYREYQNAYNRKVAK